MVLGAMALVALFLIRRTRRREPPAGAEYYNPPVEKRNTNASYTSPAMTYVPSPPMSAHPGSPTWGVNELAELRS